MALVGVKELLRALAGEHVVADRFVLARQRTKLRHPERVGKEPDVRHEIGVYRNAVFESETEDMHGNRGRSGTKQTLVQFRGQLMDAQCRGVDDDVGVLFEVLQQVAFLKDAVDQTIALLQRMGPAHGFVALDEHPRCWRRGTGCGSSPQDRPDGSARRTGRRNSHVTSRR